MNVTLVETSPGEVAQRFMQERLASGNTLAQYIARSVKLEEGHTRTLLPKGVIPKSMEDFKTGGKLATPPVSEWRGTRRRGETLLMIPVPNTNSWLAGKIKTYLSQATNRICIIEDALKQPNDEVLHNHSTRYATYRDEVYHLLLYDDAQDDRIVNTLAAAQSVPTFIGSLSMCREGSIGSALSLDQLQSLAGKTQELFVGAYDGEGYLYWTK